MFETFGTIISFFAAFFLFLISFLILVRKRTVSNASFCIAAILLGSVAIADQLYLKNSFGLTVDSRFKLFAESLLPAAFLFHSLVYSRLDPLESLMPWWRAALALAVLFPVSTFLFPVEEFFYAPDFSTEKMLFLGTAGYWFYLGITGYCILALINLEIIYSAAGLNKRKIRLEVIGVMSILSVLIFDYSQGMLYRTINMNFIPVRSGIFIIAAALIGYVKFFKDHDTRVVVSRYILYRSLTLIAVGIYFVLLGLTGEGIKHFGTSFGKNLAMFIVMASGILIFSMVSSKRLRRKAKVFINKHFYAHKHDYRDEWLRFTRRLASCRTVADVQQTILSTFMDTFGLKGASLYLLERGKGAYCRAAGIGIPDIAQQLHISPGLASYFKEQNRVLNPLDGEYALMPEELLFVRDTGSKLVVPLMADGAIEGLILFGEQVYREDFIYEDYDLMKTIAGQATLVLVNFRLSEELAETRELAAVAKISSFVIHDLKNLVYTLSLLMENADEYIEEPAFQKDMIEAVMNSTLKMKNLILMLKAVPEKTTLNSGPADIHLLVEEALAEIKKAKKDLDVNFSGVSAVSMIDKEEIMKVTINLLLNASEATGGRGAIEIETGMEDGKGYIRIKDNGCGMTEEFMTKHLFKPFRTTKKNGLGIGLYQCKQIVEAHDGKIEVQSISGRGSAFTVYLPVVETGKYVMDR